MARDAPRRRLPSTTAAAAISAQRPSRSSSPAARQPQPPKAIDPELDEEEVAAPPSPPPPLLLLDELDEEELLEETMHTPPRQLPSEHGAPSGFGGSSHTPVAAAQVPTSWHSSRAVQTTEAPTQTPARQASPLVHGLLSSQLVPSGAGGSEHSPVAGSHTPAS